MVEILERPDVRVYQEFGPEAPSLIRPLLEACVIGQCFQIETDKLAGMYLGALATYNYPGKKTGAVVSVPSVVVSLQQGTDKYDITAQLPGGSILVTGVTIPVSFVPYKRVAAQRQVSTSVGTILEDPGADFVVAGIRPGDILKFVTAPGDLLNPDSVVSTQAGNFTVLNVLSPTELEVTPALIAETKVEYYVRRNGTSSGDVLISYKAKRVDGVDTLYEFQSLDELEAELGEPVPENPLAFGMYVALQHTEGIVAGTMVEDDSLADFTDAAEFLESKEIYAIVPLTQNASVFSMLKLHCDQMSEPSNKRERIALINHEILAKQVYQAQSTTGSTAIGSDIFTDANAKFLTNAVPIGALLKFTVAQGFGGSPVTEILIKSILSETQVVVIANADATVPAITYTVESRPYTKLQQAVNLQNIGKGYQDRRVVQVVPDVAEVTQDSTVEDVPGYFLGCAVAGLISGSSPAQGFTNFPFAVFVGLKRSNFYFNETQLGVIAAGGNFIFIQETLGAPLTVRHQLTTDVTTIERRELSITKTIDFMAKYLRNRVRRLIGINNITPEFLNNILRPQTNGIIEDLVEDRIVGRQTVITRLVQDELQPDTVKVDITVEVLYPANFIDFTLII